MRLHTIVLTGTLFAGIALAQTVHQSTTQSHSQSGTGSASSSASASSHAGAQGFGSSGGSANGLSLGGTVYAVRYTFAPEAAEQTPKTVFLKHSEFLDKLESKGVLVLGGDLPTLKGELVLLRGENEDQVRNLITANDPFAGNPTIDIGVREYRITRPKPQLGR
jgi:uncharacterized protein YciI